MLSCYSYLVILSTAEKSEFHLVTTGLTSWSLQWSSMTSAAVVDLELLFHKLEHLANVDLDTLVQWVDLIDCGHLIEEVAGAAMVLG